MKLEKNTKILVIVCVILVAVLSLTIGLLIANQSNTPIVLNTTNNTNSTINTSVNQSQQNTTKNTSSQGITASQAANIALKYAKKTFPSGKWSVNAVDFVPAGRYTNSPNYVVEVANSAPNALNTSGTSMDVRVNANNGAIIA
jgi:hypothetical protein